MKNYSRWYLGVTLFCIPSITLTFDDFFEEIGPETAASTRSIFDDSDSLFEEFETGFSFDPSSMPSRATPEEAITFLLAADAIKLLEQDYFLRTNDLNKQSDLDRGIFELGFCCTDAQWRVSGHLYYNQTSRSNFTRESTNLCSYLALTQPTLLSSIQTVIDNVVPLFTPDQFNLDIPLIFGLLGMMTIQERRLGTMFHIIRSFNNDAYLRVLFPLLYLERNFFLDNGPRRRLEMELEPGDPEEQERFQNDHLISDAVGFGDLRIECDTPVACFGPSTVRLGAFVTLPTAFAIKKGLRGTNFPRVECQPPFSFLQLVNLATDGELTDEVKEQAFTILQQFFLGSLDRLSAALLDTSLGNGHHMGIGFVARTFTPLDQLIHREGARCWSWQTRLSLEYLFQASERRFFIKRNAPSDFAARNFEDENQANDNLLFLDQQLVNKFYPIALRTCVLPGIIFRWTSRLCYTGCHWNANLGTDMWIQNQAAFLNINACPRVLAEIDTFAAQTSFAYRYKILGSIDYLWTRPCRDWHFGLSGEYTLSNSGIGKDFTLAFTVGAHY